METEPVSLRNRLKDPRILIRIGSAALIVWSLSRWFLRASDTFSQNLIDGASGFTLGIAIGCLLLAARLNARRHCA